jgi:hypothetical protein
MRFRGRENAVALTLGKDRLSDSVGGLSWLSCVRTKLHMSTRMSVQSHRVLMKTYLHVSIHGFFLYYESINRKGRPTNECRCDERLKTKDEEY